MENVGEFAINDKNNSYINIYNQDFVMRREDSHKSTGKSILHYPQLDTVLMVEEFIKEHSGEYKKKQIWEHLPKKVMYQTFCVIFDYLLESGKILGDREGTICWVWNPELVKKYLARPDLLAR